jgi:hypothetical protein
MVPPSIGNHTYGMSKQYLGSSLSKLLQADISNNIKSFDPVIHNKWMIKFSICNGDKILIMFTSIYTGQCIIRYFTDENTACSYINYVISHDASIEIPA